MRGVLLPGVVIVILRLLRVDDGVLAREDRRGVGPLFGDVCGGECRGEGDGDHVEE